MPNQKQLIQEIHETVTILKTVLLGVPGTEDNGLVGKVDEVHRSHYRLKRNFYILIGVLVGSGILGTGIWGLLNG